MDRTWCANPVNFSCQDNTTDVRNMQNMYLFVFIGDKTPE